MSAATTERTRVRVVLEGTATTPVDRLDAKVLRVRLDDGPLVVVGTDWPGVTVEAVVPERVWQDGDLVEHHAGEWAAHRAGGQWHTTREDVADLDDARVTRFAHPMRGYLVVRRYQHGEVEA